MSCSARATGRDAVPEAYLAHVAEEAPGFADWARRNASERYSQRDFTYIYALGSAGTVASTLAVSRTESRVLDVAYYRLVVTPQAVFNAVFRSAATLSFRGYAPGPVTSILTIPLWQLLTKAAIAERRLTKRGVIGCTLIASLVHAGVVPRQVLFIGAPDR